MNETGTIETAQQDKYVLDGHEMPGLAFNKEGYVTQASMIDLLLQCLASLDNPKVNEILTKNKIMLRDLKGEIVFPK